MATQAVRMGSCTPASGGCCEVGRNSSPPGPQLAFWSSFRTLSKSGEALRSCLSWEKVAQKYHTGNKRGTVLVRARNVGLPKEQQAGPDKMAWIGGIFSRGNTEEEKQKAEESARELLTELKRQQIKETEEQLELDRQTAVQIERDHIQAAMWNKSLLKMRGDLKGTMWDPEDSHAIPFSEFSRLLEEERVNYLEYAEFGKDVAVILPYYNEEESLTVQPDSSNDEPSATEELSKKEEYPSDDRQIVYRRHPVDQMPADGWGDIWTKLHSQLYHVEIRQPNSLPAQLYPG